MRASDLCGVKSAADAVAAAQPSCLDVPNLLSQVLGLSQALSLSQAM